MKYRILAILLAGATASSGAQQLTSGIDTTNFDRSVRPQDDFFRFVNGNWIRKTEIPSDASGWGAFQELHERSRNVLHTIYEDVSRSNAPAGSEKRKVGDLYASYMDTARIEQLALTPLDAQLKKISELKDAKQLPATLAYFARIGIQSPVNVNVGQDPKESDKNTLTAGQSGLGLPDRDYYLRQDAKTDDTRSAYVAYIVRLLTLAKVPDPDGAANRIMAFESAIAVPQWDRAKNRDRNATYNKMTVKEMAAMMPSFSWPAYLKAAELWKASTVIVRQPDYLQSLERVYAHTPMQIWREYLTFKLLDATAQELPLAFEQARFDFRGKTLNGQQEMAVRWKRAVDGVEGILGEPAGKLYVTSQFKPEAKAKMDALVKNLRAAYSVGIDSLEWMSPETKLQAKEKLAHFTVKIGYPDVPRDYSALRIVRDDAMDNALRSQMFQYDDRIAMLGKPVNRTRWGMSPQTVNAYYNSSNNEIVFPAAILQPPFFDANADDAANYGGIGAVIGHEIGHGFDDQGRKSDGFGNLRDWWTASDATAFVLRTSKLGAQFDAINPIDDLHINGQLTMGENIGDLSGLAQAYRAWRISLNGKEPPVIDGLTGDQRFFMGFAQIWRTKTRDAALRQQLLTDPHSPGAYRAFVPLVNNDVFLSTFNVRPNDKMYRAPADRVKIW